MLILCMESCTPDHSSQYPQPIFETMVKMDMEEGKDRALKKYWFESLHQAAPNTNWEQIEFDRRFKHHKEKFSGSQIDTRGDEVNINDGYLVGQWIERGSTNQAGSILNTTYEPNSKNVFAISAGGTLYIGPNEGASWEVANQDLRFDGKILEFITLPSGIKRLLLSADGMPLYSDGAGLECEIAVGYPMGVENVIHDVAVINNGRDILLIAQQNPDANIRIYHSDDFGLSYSSLSEFNIKDPDQMAMLNTNDQNHLYISVAKTNSSSTIYKWNTSSKLFDLHEINAPIGFGANGRANLTHSNLDNRFTLYCYDDNRNFYKTLDEGKNWSYVGKIPVNPWGAGITISKQNPNIMLLAEVDCYRSTDAGKNWSRVNYWWQYYNDIDHMLHADIMNVSEFKRTNGSYFSLISNHGGISKSEDFGENNINIGKEGLNVTQYYDVKTYPAEAGWMFAGSQDQGLQSGIDLEEGALAFNQIKSGDYDHLTFTGNNEEHLWVVYPLGQVQFYPNPRMPQDHLIFSGIEGKNKSVWLPPIMKSPYNENAVFLAGGNLDGNSDSHIIKLSVGNDSEIDASQMGFNFASSGGDLSALAVNHFDNQTWYAATNNGKFYVSTNGGNSFVQKSINVPGSEYLYGAQIRPSKINKDVLYICGSGYSTSAVVKSIDGGNTWFALNNELPQTTVFEMDMNHDESLLFAATEAGPYVYMKEAGKWFAMDGGITPSCRFWSVEFLAANDKVRFGTYGRGIWDFDVLESTSTVEANPHRPEFVLSPNPVRDFLNINIEHLQNLNLDMKIYNLQGQEIYSSTLKQIENIVDCSGL